MNFLSSLYRKHVFGPTLRSESRWSTEASERQGNLHGYVWTREKRDVSDGIIVHDIDLLSSFYQTFYYQSQPQSWSRCRSHYHNHKNKLISFSSRRLRLALVFLVFWSISILWRLFWCFLLTKLNFYVIVILWHSVLNTGLLTFYTWHIFHYALAFIWVLKF